MEDELETGNQLGNSSKVPQLKPYQYKKGQSGNPSGRPAGISLKEYAKMMLNRMTNDEREEFMNGLSKDIIWEMAEGKAQSNTDLNVKGDLTVQISEAIAKKNDTHTSTKQDS